MSLLGTWSITRLLFGRLRRRKKKKRLPRRERERASGRKGQDITQIASPRLAVRPRSIKTSPSLIYRTTLIAAPLKEDGEHGRVRQHQLPLPSSSSGNPESSANGLLAVYHFDRSRRVRVTVFRCSPFKVAQQHIKLIYNYIHANTQLRALLYSETSRYNATPINSHIVRCIVDPRRTDVDPRAPVDPGFRANLPTSFSRSRW